MDKYTYQYDLLGNKTGIEKQRRGLEVESGSYRYGYDALGRLNEVVKDGNALRGYQYDAFGNRTRLMEQGKTTTYAYNTMNQLLSRVDADVEETYAYDKRGNLSQIAANGQIKNQYLYGALNRLEQAINGKGEAAKYQYNGLGHRVGKVIGQDNFQTINEQLNPVKQLQSQNIIQEKQIKYTIDFTRAYHNLLQINEDGMKHSFLWDGNVAGMYKGENDDRCYYLQDELGSPIRLIGENLYNALGYDEFGKGLYYNRNIRQPFGYTGYQMDFVSNTYFAQAREYQAETGRFLGQDKIVGIIILPTTLNLYNYCLQAPLDKTDETGFWFGWDDLAVAAVGAVIGIGSQVVSDVVSSVVTGEVQVSSWQTYLGAGVGGAAGAVTTLYAGPVAGAAVEGGVATLVEEGVTKLTDPTYEKDWATIAIDSGKDAVIGGSIGFVFNGFRFGDERVDTVKNAANGLSDTINNPALQRRLASRRAYYVNKALKDISKAKGRYMVIVMDYIKQALRECIAPSEIIASLLPDMPDYVSNILQNMGKIFDENPEIINQLCIE